MPTLDGLLLRSLELRPWPERLDSQFPFVLPVIRGMGKLELPAPVTFLVGENGSGKSTLLEALACSCGLATVGGVSTDHDPSLNQVRELAQYLRLVWSKRTRKGFFLRAEDFFGYARRMSEIKDQLAQDLHNAEIETSSRSKMAQQYGTMPYRSELSDLRRRYGEGVDSRSHGESFLLLFQQRFIPGGLYLLDEPEAPLSPTRQLAMLAILQRMVKHGAQFIIATHSPILMALPGAQILSFDGGNIHPTPYEELENVRLTRDFLNNPQIYLRELEAMDENS